MASNSISSLSPDQLFERLANIKWLPIAVNIAAFVLLAYSMAQWTWRVLDTSKPRPVTAARIEAEMPKLDVQTLLTAQLFGQVQVSTANVDPNQIPLSSLNLVLTGVMARGPSSFAFLSINGAPETFLTIGQEVTSGATLEAVYPDRIVLRRGAALESVLLKDSEAVLPPGAITVADQGPIRALGNGNFSVDRKELNKSLTPETLSQASVTAGPNGLAVRSVQAGSIFEKLGLRAGDVVRYMNGQPVNSLEHAMAVYAQSMAGEETEDFSVEILRSGKIEVLTYKTQRNL